MTVEEMVYCGDSQDVIARALRIQANTLRKHFGDELLSCASLFRISHARLDRVIAGQGYRGEFLQPEDMARIEGGIRAALGL